MENDYDIFLKHLVFQTRNLVFSFKKPWILIQENTISNQNLEIPS